MIRLRCLLSVWNTADLFVTVSGCLLAQTHRATFRTCEWSWAQCPASLARAWRVLLCGCQKDSIEYCSDMTLSDSQDVKKKKKSHLLIKLLLKRLARDVGLVLCISTWHSLVVSEIGLWGHLNVLLLDEESHNWDSVNNFRRQKGESKQINSSPSPYAYHQQAELPTTRPTARACDRVTPYADQQVAWCASLDDVVSGIPTMTLTMW